MPDEPKRTIAIAFVVLGVVFVLASATYSSVIARSVAADIQNERLRNVITNCAAINERHDNTIRALDKIIARLPVERRKQASAGRVSTVLLINALAPKRDCKALAESQVKAGA